MCSDLCSARSQDSDLIWYIKTKTGLVNQNSKICRNSKLATQVVIVFLLTLVNLALRAAPETGRADVRGGPASARLVSLFYFILVEFSLLNFTLI